MERKPFTKADFLSMAQQLREASVPFPSLEMISTAEYIDKMRNALASHIGNEAANEFYNQIEQDAYGQPLPNSYYIQTKLEYRLLREACGQSLN